MELRTVFTRDEIQRSLHPEVVVEMWRNVMTTGFGKRKFKAEFSEDEQKAIRKVYTTIYCPWCFKSHGGGGGIPEKSYIELRTFILMQRAANFFGTYPI